MPPTFKASVLPLSPSPSPQEGLLFDPCKMSRRLLILISKEYGPGKAGQRDQLPLAGISHLVMTNASSMSSIPWQDGPW